MLPWIALTLAAVALLLVAEFRGSHAGVWVAKPLASTGFLGAALAAGAQGSGYGRWVLAGLAVSWLGDVLLIPHARAAFLAGLVSFLLGHVAYAVAFAERGLSVGGVVLAALALVPAALAALRWLGPHVPAEMRLPVRAYVTVISAMVACAVGTEVAASAPAILVGALMFFVSDLAVARDRFVAPGPWNRAWGLPLYYGAQLVLASTTSLANP
jgi:uncharacterized membrane protein YhhN